MNHDDQAVSSECRRFFAELVPRLDTARTLERELDRNLARRFNCFDYLRTDELGLSRVIADLLNPNASHGQDVLFLRTLLDRLPMRNWPDPGANKISVLLERGITDGRRIDISVQIGEGRAAYCLAFENKPYAEDQKDQVKDYLEFLEHQYEKRFLLLYMSPTGEGPSEESIPGTELEENWQNVFAIMPYHRGQGEPGSLVDWFQECRRVCEVERLRWFLRDAEVFCEGFGGQKMTTDGETLAVRDFVLSSPNNLKVALALQESWSTIKETVCKKFLEMLCARIQERINQSDRLTNVSDLHVGHEYGGESRYSNIIWLYRGSWATYSFEQLAQQVPSSGRTYIAMDNQHTGSNGWIMGVHSPMPADDMESSDLERRRCLEARLRKEVVDLGRTTPWWPRWDWVLDDKRNWDALILDLHNECEAAGEITKYFVDRFADIAEKAIPIIDEIEGREG